MFSSLPGFSEKILKIGIAKEMEKLDQDMAPGIVNAE